MSDRDIHQLRRDGVGVVVESGPGLPRVLHWGADLGPVTGDALAELVRGIEPGVPRNALDAPWPFPLVPGQPDGWLGRPGFAAHRDGAVLYPRWRTRTFEATDHAWWCEADDPDSGLALRCGLELRPGGALVVRHRLRNTGTGWVWVERLHVTLPLPDAATEVLDLTGRWSKERTPQRAPLRFGSWVRESRRGRTGHDATLVLYAGTAGFTNRTGAVWGVHVAVSGNHVHAVERLPEGAGGAAAVLGGGELLEPGEIGLAPGEEYATPEVWFVWSDSGLDGAAHRFHTALRARSRHPRTPRPLVLNTWEAVYSNHDHEKLFALARRAAEIGVERFVLDDGWFTGRAGTDRRGLGDWFVDPVTWPEGLGPLVRHVRELGMQFGLWVEPEMANPDSELLRRHPDWVLGTPGRQLRTARHQVAIDLARPEVADYLFDRIAALVEEYDIDYLKWDHNRDIHEPVHAGIGGVHRQTRAVYALMDRLRARFPRLEIESCSSGGGRVDLGILSRTDRIWVSDTNDPTERQRIQRWTSQLVPLELQGTHIGPPYAHTTGRYASLRFRALTALFGHAGIEWDVTECTDDEVATLQAWAALYRQLRPLLHTGRLVHPDHGDENVVVTGVVAEDTRHAVYLYARLDTSVAANGERLRLDGLDDSLSYQVRVRTDLGEVPTMGVALPQWIHKGVTLPGRVLRTVGLAVPQLPPSEAMLIEATAEP